MQQVLEVGGHTVRLVAIVFAKPWLLRSVCLKNKAEDAEQPGADTAPGVPQELLPSEPGKGQECLGQEEQLGKDTQCASDDEPPRKRCKTDVLEGDSRLCQGAQPALASADGRNLDAAVAEPVLRKEAVTGGEEAEGGDSLGGQEEPTAELPEPAAEAVDVDTYKEQGKSCSEDKELEVESNDLSTEHSKQIPIPEQSASEQDDDLSYFQENPGVSKGMDKYSEIQTSSSAVDPKPVAPLYKQILSSLCSCTESLSSLIDKLA